MNRGRAIAAGLFAGTLAGLVMTVVMLLLAWLFGVATPLAIFGDRLSVFIPADTFLSLMGRVGGYNHMKQLGVGSVMFGQLLIGGLGGMVYGLVSRHRRYIGFPVTGTIFLLLPLAAVAIFLWPVLGTHYLGLPIRRAALVTVLGLGAALAAFGRTLVLAFRFLTRPTIQINDQEFSPHIGRRAMLLAGLGILFAGGGAGLLRKLYGIATFSYDGIQYKDPMIMRWSSGLPTAKAKSRNGTKTAPSNQA